MVAAVPQGELTIARSSRASPAATPAVEVLQRAGVPFMLHPYEVAADARSYGEAVALTLGLDTGRVFKTLIVTADGRLVVGVVPVAASLDLKALAAVVGAKRAAMAEPAAAERSSGYVTGGISPLGQRTALPTVVDTSALEWPTIFVSAGRRGLQLEVAPTDLVVLTGGSSAPIAVWR